jgi:hypothetical protein
MLDKVLTPNDRKEALGVWSFFGLIENRQDGLTLRIKFSRLRLMSHIPPEPQTGEQSLFDLFLSLPIPFSRTGRFMHLKRWVQWLHRFV